MRKRQASLIAVGILAVCLVCCYIILYPRYHRKRSTVEVYGLSNVQLSELIKRAKVDRDAQAAFRVYLHFLLSVGDNAEALRWLKIAADNGYYGAEYALACLLMQTAPLGTTSHYDEVKNWLQKGALLGDEQAHHACADWESFRREWERSSSEE